MCVVFNKVEHGKFEAEEKTGNGSSFVRHFDEKPSKMAENRRKSVRVSRIRGPLELGGPRRWPPVAGPTPNTPSVGWLCCFQRLLLNIVTYSRLTVGY